MIELKNVTKKYGNFKAIDDVSFIIEKGEIVGFLGQNGAGKTTTMKLITGLLEPTDGEVIIDGKKFSKKSNSIIGYMPENTPLYDSLTVKEFIDFMAELKGIKKSERKDLVKELINSLNLADVENKLIRNISRGYKQRVSLAGALVGKPEILILDEPTVGLDPKQIIEIRNLIKSLKKDHTILLSSHILSEVNQICEKVIIINKGKIIAIDTPSNLESKISKNIIDIIVEDPENNMERTCKKIPDILNMKYIKTENKNEKEYELYIKENVDVRRRLMDVLPKENIIIVELKKSESTLEEVFMNLIKEGGN